MRLESCILKGSSRLMFLGNVRYYRTSQTVVELYRFGIQVSQLSSESYVSEVTIYKWIKIHSSIEGTNELTASEVTAVQKENLRL